MTLLHDTYGWPGYVSVITYSLNTMTTEYLSIPQSIKWQGIQHSRNRHLPSPIDADTFLAIVIVIFDGRWFAWRGVGAAKGCQTTPYEFRNDTKINMFQFGQRYARIDVRAISKVTHGRACSNSHMGTQFTRYIQRMAPRKTMSNRYQIRSTLCQQLKLTTNELPFFHKKHFEDRWG